MDRRILSPLLVLLFTASCSVIEPSSPPPPRASSTTLPTTTLRPTPTGTRTETPQPTLTLSPSPTQTPQPSATPSRTPTQTSTATPTEIYALRDAEGQYFILNDKVLFHPGPSGEELDQALASAHPEWASFTQIPEWYNEPLSAGQIVEDASFEETFQLNSAVTLVTVGVVLDWQQPPEGDLYTPSRIIGESLVTLWYQWAHPDNDAIRAEHPEMANGATYAIYSFFGYRESKLREWCEAYVELFGSSPKIPP